MSEDILDKYGGDFNKNVDIWELFSLKGNVAIVTGGAGAYGYSISTALAEAGATVVLASRGVDECEVKAGHLRERSLSAVGMALDLRSDESIVALRDAVVERFGTVDILFNNALGRPTDTAERQALSEVIKSGVSRKATMEQMTRRMWERALEVNGSGLFTCCQVFAETMRAKGTKGSIINVASTYGCVAPDLRFYVKFGANIPPEYSFSKGGIINFTR